jgi:hypothetical protein
MVGLAYAAQAELAMGLLGGAALGATMGVAQWLVLRRRWGVPVGWVLASIAGGMAGLALGMVLAEMIIRPLPRATDRETAALMRSLQAALNAGVSGALLGVGLGSAHWLMLRRRIRRMGGWIIANGAGWMVALALGAALADVIGVLGAVAAAGLTAGSITGIVLWRHFRAVAWPSGV